LKFKRDISRHLEKNIYIVRASAEAVKAAADEEYDLQYLDYGGGGVDESPFDAAKRREELKTTENEQLGITEGGEVAEAVKAPAYEEYDRQYLHYGGGGDEGLAFDAANGNEELEPTEKEQLGTTKGNDGLVTESSSRTLFEENQKYDGETTTDDYDMAMTDSGDDMSTYNNGSKETPIHRGIAAAGYYGVERPAIDDANRTEEMGTTKNEQLGTTEGDDAPITEYTGHTHKSHPRWVTSSENHMYDGETFTEVYNNETITKYYDDETITERNDMAMTDSGDDVSIYINDTLETAIEGDITASTGRHSI
jgi:hypothetical protein